MAIRDRLRDAWHAFRGTESEFVAPQYEYKDLGMSSYIRPDRPRFTRGNERSIVTAIYNRFAVDASSLTIEHARVDSSGRYVDTIDDDLNTCLTVEANRDQTGRAFMQDVVQSMLDEGCVAVVPTVAYKNPIQNDSFKIYEMRTGKILQWYPEHIQIHLFNDALGKYQDITLPKKMVAIIENPFYAIINEPNSTMQRLIRTLNQLDAVGEQSASGKLDLIIQLPYVIKSDARREQAELRRAEIEKQLAGSKYGIAYADGTEKIIQLNRSIENNLMKTVEYLTSMLFSQLGISQSVLDGTASPEAMTNYYTRIIEPIMSAITDEMNRKFLTKTARSQGQRIVSFRDPFKLVPVAQVASIADTMTRNEIMTSNEVRQTIGMKPSSDPNADELRNKNLSAPAGTDDQIPTITDGEPVDVRTLFTNNQTDQGEIQNG